MKKNLSTILGSLLTAAAVSVLSCIPSGFTAYAQQNLLDDGSFEALEVGTEISKVQSNDVAVWAHTDNVKSAVISDDMASDGTKSVKVFANYSDADSSHMPSINYVFRAEAGKTYICSADVHAEEGVNDGNPMYIRINNNDNDSESVSWGAGVTQFDKAAAKSGWATASTPAYTMKKDGVMRVNIVLLNAKEGTAQYVDNVRVYEAGSEPEPEPDPEPDPSEPEDELVKDGGFEKAALGTSIPNNADIGGYAVTGAEASVSDERPANGKQSVKIEPADNADSTIPAFNYYIALAAGKYYCASARVFVGERMTDRKSTAGSVYIRFADTSNPWDARGIADEAEAKNGYVTIRTFFTADKDYAKARINIGMYNGYYQYIDDVSCAEVGEIAALEKTDFNELSLFGEIPVTSQNARLELTFGTRLDKDSVNSDNIMLNGEKAENAVLTLAENEKTLTVELSGLSFGKYYVLSLSSDKWQDKFARQMNNYELIFKTSGRVSVGSFDSYSGNTKITDGKLAAGTVAAKAQQLENLTDTEQTATIFFVLYKDGKIVQTKEKKVSLDAGESAAELSESITVPSLSDGSYIMKIFLWDSADSAISLHRAITLN